MSVGTPPACGRDRVLHDLEVGIEDQLLGVDDAGLQLGRDGCPGPKKSLLDRPPVIEGQQVQRSGSRGWRLDEVRWLRHDARVSIAGGYLAEIDGPDVAWERETVPGLLASLSAEPALVRDESLVRYAAAPVVPFAIKFAVGRWPGQDAGEDAEWAAAAALARRRLTVWQEARIENTSTEFAVGMLNWVEDRIGSWDDQDFASLVRSRVDGLLDSLRRGREHGMRLRETRAQIPPLGCSACWVLRHPGDHYFRRARDNATDACLCELLDAQIAVLSDRYDRLSAEHHFHGAADVILELGVLGTLSADWRDPIRTTVQAANTDAVTVGEQIGLRLVADPNATFNGLLASVRARERWLTVVDRIRDRTIIPRDGTRRLAA